MKRLIGSLIAVALLAGPVAADAAPAHKAKAKKTAAPAEPPLAPDVREAAEQVVKLTGAEETNERALAEQSAELRTGTLVQQEVDRSPELRAARQHDPAAWAPIMKRFGERQADILDEVRQPLQARYHERLVRAYATHFTVDELKGLADFYASPLGQKLQATAPAMMAEENGWLQDQIAQGMGPKVATLKNEFRDAIRPLMATSGADKGDGR